MIDEYNNFCDETFSLLLDSYDMEFRGQISWKQFINQARQEFSQACEKWEKEPVDEDEESAKREEMEEKITLISGEGKRIYLADLDEFCDDDDWCDLWDSIELIYIHDTAIISYLQEKYCNTPDFFYYVRKEGAWIKEDEAWLSWEELSLSRNFMLRHAPDKMKDYFKD